MDVFDLIFGERNRDPYESGRTGRYSKFVETGVFSTTTAHGFTVQYELWCNYEKVDHDAFKRARMLDPGSRKEFLRKVNAAVVTRLLNSLGRFVRIFPDTSTLPQLCRVVEIDGKQCVARDLNCADLIDELCESRFKADGCVTGKMLLKFRSYNASEQIIDENFIHMHKHFDAESIRANPAFAAQEEAWMIALAKGEIELRKRFALQRLSQDHTSKRLFVRARVIGSAIEIQWQLTEALEPGERIKGFRFRDGKGFEGVENTDCIALATSGGSVALTLPPGTQQYFSFLITRNDAQFFEEDSIHFTIRIPTAVEQAEFDAFLAKAESKSPPLTEKTKSAVEELMAFVEFDEHVSELEKHLVARINAKEYSEDEKAERINRLKLLVESIHLRGYAGLAVEESEPRWLFPADRARQGVEMQFRKEQLLFNAHRLSQCSNLVVVSEIDSVWRLHECGYDAAVSTMSDGCSEGQAALIASFLRPDGRLWILSCGDEPGSRFAHAVLEHVAPKRFVRWSKLGRDKTPSGLSRDEMQQCFA